MSSINEPFRNMSLIPIIDQKRNMFAYNSASNARHVIATDVCLCHTAKPIRTLHTAFEV